MMNCFLRLSLETHNKPYNISFTLQSIEERCSIKNKKRMEKKKINFDEIPKHAIRASYHGIRWLMMLILIYIVASTLILLVTQGYTLIKDIVTLSIGGFFAFFMGYFGWVFAENIMKSFNERIKKD